MQYYLENGGNIAAAAREAGYSRSYYDKQPDKILSAALNYHRALIENSDTTLEEELNTTLGFSREELIKRTRELHEQNDSIPTAWKVNKALHRKQGVELGENDTSSTQAVQVNIEISEKNNTVTDTVEVTNED